MAASRKPAQPKTKSGYPDLPAGYKPIVSGVRAEKWEFESQPLLEGVIVGDVREVDIGAGKNKRTSRVLTVEQANGDHVDVWDSASLSRFFDAAKDGMRCAIAFQGYEDVGKPQPMKVFKAGLLAAEGKSSDDNDDPFADQ